MRLFDIDTPPRLIVDHNFSGSSCSAVSQHHHSRFPTHTQRDFESGSWEEKLEIHDTEYAPLGETQCQNNSGASAGVERNSAWCHPTL